MTDRQKSIVMFSRDPGGANQMIALHGLIAGWWKDAAVSGHPEITALFDRIVPKSPQAELLTIAKDYAVEVWQRSGQDFVDWDDLAPSNEARAAIRKLFVGNAIAALLSATSDVDDETDFALWAEAATRNVPVHVFIDQNTNIAGRFTASDGTIFFPDHIYVPDVSARRPLAELGISSDAIHVIPELHLLRQQALDSGDVTEIRRRIRSIWGVPSDCRVILFASENVAELKAAGKESPYSEFECLRRLTDQITKGGHIGGQAARGNETVVVRPHPKDHPGKYGAITSPIPIIVSAAGSARESIIAADVIVGMRSMLLDEARVLGRPVTSMAADQASDP